MLIEFSLTNIRSFRETQTLNLACSKYFKEVKESCFDTEIAGLPKLLRSVAIYGPNASGKSNLLSSLNKMRTLVLSSAKKIQEGEELNVVPFMLDQSSKTKGSEVEVIFIEGGVRYQYGFALNNLRVLREWLIAYPEGRPQRWFDRIFEENSAEYVYEFGPKFLGGRLRHEWRRVTRRNSPPKNCRKRCLLNSRSFCGKRWKAETYLILNLCTETSKLMNLSHSALMKNRMAQKTFSLSLAHGSM